ncbi:MAG TPA: homogentisate 1,2-dioxygenase [Alphaproteobacteria bacterium]|nr:homogentisate 1,2-dioxygenase [Alphaproteobacteria bacterium]
MRKWIAFPRREGLASRQAHCDLPAGTYEREFGKEGFFGPVTQLYHRHPPTGWSEWEGPLRPRAFDLVKLNHVAASPWEATEVLHNAHVKLRFWRGAGRMDHLVRNGDGDEIVFFHEGEGDLFCDFGRMTFREGDYVMLPRGTMWRIEARGPFTALLIEATNDSYVLPEKGIVGAQAVYDPGVLETPVMDEAFRAQQTEEPWRVAIKRSGAVSTVTFPYNPLDTVGWQGDLVPVKLNWRDIRPVMSHRFHIPPSAHTTFLAARFVVCTFVPRPLESDPGALKVPFYHSNNDFDEVIFYHRGEFFSRDNIHPGMVTLHPCGFPHGPHPKAFAAGARAAKKETDEVAVMIDARDALAIGKLPEGVEWTGYVESWKPRREAAE